MPSRQPTRWRSWRCGTARLHALNPTTGRERWHTPAQGANGSGTTAPAIADGRVYFDSRGPFDLTGSLNAYSAATGALEWSAPGGGCSGPATTAAVIYQHSENTLTAFDATTGTVRFVINDFTSCDDPTAVDSMHVYGGASASDRFTGRHLYDLPGLILRTSVANGVVFSDSQSCGRGNCTERLVAVEAASGRVLAMPGVTTHGFPVVADGRLYVSSDPDATGSHLSLMMYQVP